MTVCRDSSWYLGPGQGLAARPLRAGRPPARRGGFRVSSPAVRPTVALDAPVAGEPRPRGTGRPTDLAELGHVLASPRARSVAGNTGPAHLAAAVGTPVVSLFAPTVPVARGGRHAACPSAPRPRASVRRVPARVCPVAGHPCLSCVAPGRGGRLGGGAAPGRWRWRCECPGRHVHGAWTTSFVHGPHATWSPSPRTAVPWAGAGPGCTNWPAAAEEVIRPRPPTAEVDVIVLQRPEELDRAAASGSAPRAGP